MGKEVNPTLRVFGSNVRRYRKAAGLTVAQLAEAIHYAAGYVSNIENGQKTPRRVVVVALDDALQAEGALLELYGLLNEHGHTVENFERYADAEAIASVIYKYEVLVIPGLLQTEDYARALLTGRLAQHTG